MMPALPSHRQFLSSLINLPSQQSNDQTVTTAESRRRLLSLHVLFPTLLLPALDLLDRSLVTRITHQDAEAPSSLYPAPTVFIVKSAAVKPPRRGRPAAPSRSYVVRLDSWNCTCASFSLDAFLSAPGPQQSVAAPGLGSDLGGDSSTFGGFSIEGGAGSSKPEHVPCCKHILASWLAEHWSDSLGGYVDKRQVTKEEMAGIVGMI